jgi:hypothetical protein
MNDKAIPNDATAKQFRKTDSRGYIMQSRLS